jgi:methyl-accepting chemotaxis protein
VLKTVSAKLSASAALALLIVVAVTGIGLLTQQQLLARAQSISAAADAVRQVTAVRAALARARRHEQEAIVATAHADLMELRAASWSEAMQELRRALAGLRGSIGTAAGQGDALATVDAHLKRYETGFQDTLAAVKQGLLGDASIADGTMEEPRQGIEAADGQVAQLAQALVTRADETRAQMLTASRQARATALALLALFAGIGIASAVLMRRAILRPLAEAIAIARRVAAGNLAPAEVRPRGDEFGQLLRALDDMRGQLQALVAGVGSSVESVATAATEIANGNLDLSVRTERQAASLQAASFAVQRVSDSIVHSAGGAQAASAAADTMFGAAQRDGERVGRVVETMQRILQATQRIQQITALIDDIATQTHILGLNASVEASNAGERGRGFGVVAANVRQLAERCREAASDVRSLLAEARGQADEGMQLARQAGSGIVALIGSARAVSEHVGAISRSAQEQRDAIEAVGASMAEIDGATQQNAALVEQAAAAAQSLKDQADRLAETVAAFKLS